MDIDQPALLNNDDKSELSKSLNFNNDASNDSGRVQDQICFVDPVFDSLSVTTMKESNKQEVSSFSDIEKSNNILLEQSSGKYHETTLMVTIASSEIPKRDQLSSNTEDNTDVCNGTPSAVSQEDSVEKPSLPMSNDDNMILIGDKGIKDINDSTIWTVSEDSDGKQSLTISDDEGLIQPASLMNLQTITDVYDGPRETNYPEECDKEPSTPISDDRNRVKVEDGSDSVQLTADHEEYGHKPSVLVSDENAMIPPCSSMEENTYVSDSAVSLVYQEYSEQKSTVSISEEVKTKELQAKVGATNESTKETVISTTPKIATNDAKYIMHVRNFSSFGYDTQVINDLLPLESPKKKDDELQHRLKPHATPSKAASPKKHAETLIGEKSPYVVTTIETIANQDAEKMTDLKLQEKLVDKINDIPNFDSIPVTSTESMVDTWDYQSSTRIRLGICAMDKKARSKPMAEILSRLDEKLFEIIFFGDDCIVNKPIETWPICDVLIAFFSKGYPIEKVKSYVKNRNIKFNVNDLDMQKLLQDRRRVYDLLEASGIDVPKHVYLSRDGYISTGTGAGNKKLQQKQEGASEKAENTKENIEEDVLLEFDDHIEINGITINKPFVEKPVNAEDHNISIYYPSSAGGGCKKLFRKIGNRSSEFYPDIHEVRRDGGSYIYEEFVETQGTDVKMYTVGPEYGHAEARKSPTVDGKVQRNSDGKEVRFPVILTFREKEIARRIVLVFKQFVCGFDILRVQEGHSLVSYVCDVNGWSFVKNSRKYYDDCAQILSEHICAVIKPTLLKGISTLNPLTLNREDTERKDKRSSNILFRAARMLLGQPTYEEDDEDDEHSAQTQTIENSSTSQSPTRYHNDVPIDATTILSGTSAAAATLVEGALPVREFPNNLTAEPASLIHSGASSVTGDATPQQWSRAASDVLEETSHQEELRCVVAIIRHGDRTPKQKLKVNMKEPHILEFFHKHVKDCKKDLKVKAKTPMYEFLATVKVALDIVRKDRSAETEGLRYQLMHMRDILERWKIAGLNRKLQIKPRKFEEYDDEETGESKTRCAEVQLILKWGGNLTMLGEKQAINLGKRFRVEMYPDAPGGGILRLHSTFRHDLKIKTSDEGRVMKTAAAFAKGLLELEGDLPPILISLVHKEKSSMHMLDPSGNKEVKLELDECKARITENLQRDINVSEAKEAELEKLYGPRAITSIREALATIENPRKMLIRIHDTMGELIKQLEDMLDSITSGDERRFDGGEGLKGDQDETFALSGVKLYKGETLLELTERWRFIYDRLCTFDDDGNMRFDLSRIPDIHDNVRFDLLHNPHLGLSDTLDKLYDMAKVMADCVVPQEYGTTIQEKRSVGVKICQGLLEKIKFDLVVARTDNEVDMRYLINMDYSADLPINTMGRRIRTRLYFTSESHLHTVLNVLRFGSGYQVGKPMLSDEGVSFINSTPELCYLTQIVIRVFEDTRLRCINDPRRFRVEILFSPGATAPPRHLQELERELDKSRFETAPLQAIGRDGLTCEELETFFDAAIQAGGKKEDFDDPVEVMSQSTMPHSALRGIGRLSPSPSIISSNKEIASQNLHESQVGYTEDDTACQHNGSDKNSNIARENESTKQINADNRNKPKDADWELISILPDKELAQSEGEQAARRIFSRKMYWGTVAISSFVLGAGCLLYALHLSTNSSRSGGGIGGGNVRRWSTAGR